MNATYFTQRSRAYYRHTAMQQTLGMKKVDTCPTVSDCTVGPAVDAHDNLENERERVIMGFASARYAFLENCANAPLIITRSGPSHVKASVKYRTRDGTALAGADYEAAEGVVNFGPEEMKKTVFIKIHDDNAYEENEEFYVDLFEPTCEDEESN